MFWRWGACRLLPSLSLWCYVCPRVQISHTSWSDSSIHTSFEACVSLVRIYLAGVQTERCPLLVVGAVHASHHDKTRHKRSRNSMKQCTCWIVLQYTRHKTRSQVCKRCSVLQNRLVSKIKQANNLAQPARSGDKWPCQCLIQRLQYLPQLRRHGHNHSAKLDSQIWHLCAQRPSASDLGEPALLRGMQQH
jgi:hypothetical protein